MRKVFARTGASDADGPVQVDLTMSEPSPGAASTNYRDQLVSRRLMGCLPDRDLMPTPGMAGDIEAEGEDVSSWAVGDRVASYMSCGRVDGQPPGELDFGIGGFDINGVLGRLAVLPADSEQPQKSCNSIEQGTGLGNVVHILGGQGGGYDPASAGVHAKVQHAPRPARCRPVLLKQRRVQQGVSGANPVWHLHSKDLPVPLRTRREEKPWLLRMLTGLTPTISTGPFLRRPV